MLIDKKFRRKQRARKFRKAHEVIGTISTGLAGIIVGAFLLACVIFTINTILLMALVN